MAGVPRVCGESHAHILIPDLAHGAGLSKHPQCAAALGTASNGWRANGTVLMRRSKRSGPQQA